MAYQRLNPLKNPKPYNVLSLDAEWDDENVTYVWCVWGHYKGKTINRTFLKHQRDDVVHFLFRQRWYHTILTGMNLQVDLNTLLYKGGFDWTPLLANGNFLTAIPDEKTARKNKGATLKLMDIYNFFNRNSLKGLAESFGITGVYIDKHFISEHTEEEMIEACMSHAKTGVLVLEHIQEIINGFGSDLHITPALTAQTLHRRVYLPKKAQILDKYCDITHEDNLFHFKSYFGGRTEVFKRGKVRSVCGIDINSSYPNVMVNNQYPNMSTYHEHTRTTVKDLKSILFAHKGGNFRYEGVATVKVEAPEGLDIPLLPLRRDGKILFPVGTWTATYTFPELRKAHELGYKFIDVLKCGKTRAASVNMFESFVKGLYPLKEDENLKPMAKLMLNSLYGKFGQKTNENSGWVPIEEGDEIDVDRDDGTGTREIHGQYFKKIKATDIEERGFAPKSYLLMASYITTYARLFLYDMMARVGIDALVYVDTDSIYCDQKRLGELRASGDIIIHKTALGAWDIEHQHTTMFIRGLKYYRLYENNKYSNRIKGVNGNLQAEYWINGKVDLSKMVKYSGGLRGNKVLNSVYTQTREDRHPDAKRYFKDGESSSTPLIVNQL